MLGRFTIAFALVVLFAATVSAEPFEDVEFTVLYEDADDFMVSDFHDITEVAVGEPGDDTLVFRISAYDIHATDVPEGSIDIWFTAPSGNFRTSIGPGGDTFGDAFAGCEFGETAIYCWHPYAALGAAAGDEITANRAISYVGLAQDYAPGGLFWENYATTGAGLLSNNYGEDYTLVGSTVKVAAPETVEEAVEEVEEAAESVETVEETVEDVDLTLEFENATNAVHEYTWATDLTTVAADFGTNMTEGSVTLTVVDGANTTLISADMLGNITFEEVLEGAAGNWTFTFTFNDYVGTAFLHAGHVVEEVDDAAEHTDDMDHTEGEEAGTDTTPAAEASTPGFALVSGLAVLGAVGVLARRRF